MSATSCPIWKTPAIFHETSGDFSDIDSPRAGGRFEITGTAREIVSEWSDEMNMQRAALSQAILEASIVGAKLRLSADDLGPNSPLLKPRRHNETMMLFLRTVVHLNPNMGELFFTRTLSPEIHEIYCAALAWEKTQQTLDFFKRHTLFLRHGREIGIFDESDAGFSVSFRGFQQVEDLGIVSKESPRIFVAMWFGADHTNTYFEKAVKPAIRAAGYECVRIDEKHHNERIDEQILAEIRNSMAVFVDITCGLASPIDWSEASKVGAPRGGVYFEAGFAAGLGKPIIWSVEESHAEVENVVHFDVRQYNQIRWGANHEENRKFLQARLEATLGRGQDA